MGDMGFVWMHTATLTGALDGLRRTGTVLGEDWGAVSRAIQGHQAGIGAGDLLAGAFRATYDQPAQIVRTSAGQTPGLYDQLVSDGAAGRVIYVGADAGAAAGFPR
jgi:hypothetical protein